MPVNAPAHDVGPAPTPGRRTIHVAMTVDGRHLAYAMVVARSFMRCASPGDAYVLHLVLPPQEVPGEREAVSLLAGAYPGLACDVRRIPQGLQDRFEAAAATNHLPASSYFRLALPHVLADVSRTIYLDTDVTVLDDLARLWDVDLGGCVMGGVHEAFCGRPGRFTARHQEALGLSYDGAYVNSGVLLLDLAALRRDGLCDRLLGELSRDLPFGDQDILNVTCRGRIRMLPLRYDVLAKELDRGILHDGGCYSAQELAEVDAGGAVVLHYAGPEDKPWRYLQLRRSAPWLRQAEEILPPQVLDGVWRRWRKLWVGLDPRLLMSRCASAGHVVVHGFTRHGRACVDLLLDGGISVDAMSDNYPDSWGSTYRGICCLSPQEAGVTQEDAMVVVSSQVNHGQAMRSLELQGVPRGRMTRFFDDDATYRSELLPRYADGVWPIGGV